MKLYISILGLAGLLLAPGATEQSTNMTTIEAATSSALTSPSPAPPLLLRAVPQTDGAAILQRACTTCHDLGGIDEFANSGEQATRDLVSTMVGYGAVLSAEEIDVLVAHLLATYGTAAEAGQDGPATFDETAGVSLLNSKCTTCHDLSGVERGMYPPEEWVETVDRMMGYGLALTEEEYDTILTTLGTAPGAAPAGQSAGGQEAGDAGAAAFDEAAAGQLVDSKCTTCHDLTGIERGLYPAEEWAETVDRMIEYGLALTEEEYSTILTYLGTAPGEGGGGTAPGEAGDGAGPAADGYDAARAEMLLNTSCTTCHDLTGITSAPGAYTEVQFRDTILRMTGYGLVLSEAEIDVLVRYLTETYGAE
jgi:cytochrome c5